jgi:sialic acid synthase SpsE
MDRQVDIASKRVGGNSQTYIVLEAGPTHGGFHGAVKLVEAAASGGVDAIKFQIFYADDVMQDPQIEFAYEILVSKATGETRRASQSLFEILRERELAPAEWQSVTNLCHSLGLSVFFTVGTLADVDLVKSIGGDSIKIASGDITHRTLIEYAARSGLPIQLDSGGGTLAEIKRALQWAETQPDWSGSILHHCATGYPAKPETVGLANIKELRRHFDCPIAFSDHSPGWEMDIVAVALGADLVEKNVTLDRLTPKIEHAQAIEVSEIASFVSAIRSVEAALVGGSSELKASPSVTRRGCYLVQGASAGTALKDLSIAFKRPCLGLEPWEIDLDAGKRLRIDLPAGHALVDQDLM